MRGAFKVNKLENIKKPEPVKVTIDGKQYAMQLRVENVGKLREAFGTVGAADAELVRVLTTKDETGQTEYQKFSADFLTVMTKYLDCVIIGAPKNAFLSADITELQGISESIGELIKRYMPKPKSDIVKKPGKKIDPM